MEMWYKLEKIYKLCKVPNKMVVTVLLHDNIIVHPYSFEGIAFGYTFMIPKLKTQSNLKEKDLNPFH
jgi:hypothetical protein